MDFSTTTEFQVHSGVMYGSFATSHTANSEANPCGKVADEGGPESAKRRVFESADVLERILEMKCPSVSERPNSRPGQPRRQYERTVCCYLGKSAREPCGTCWKCIGESEP